MNSLSSKNGTILEVEGLTKRFPIVKGFFRRTVGYVHAVEDVHFTIAPGETLGLVGESGCGKTTTGRLILRLLGKTAGRVHYHYADGHRIDVASLPPGALRAFRREIQLIFQDPFSSLNPRMTVFDVIAEPLKAQRWGTAKEIRDRIKELVEAVGLKTEFLPRYPHAFSGGQRQRIGIARALALEPRLIVCDEPVSALDVSVQAQILNLLKDLQEKTGVSYLFIAHDLSVVENISHRIAVMYAGRIVEMARSEDLFIRPRHPYTETLIQAVPKADPHGKKAAAVPKGEVADPSGLPPGCAFHPRCPYAEERCKQEIPPLGPLGAAHHTACLRADELTLKGIGGG